MSDEASKKRREDIIAKVRALRAKTVENNATEAEALAAAAKAKELMDKYDLEMDELSVEEEGVRSGDYEPHPTFARHMALVCAAIAELCGVRTWEWLTARKVRTGKRCFFGLPHDVEVALYLADICERAMRDDVNRKAREWLLYDKRRQQKLSDSFLSGMADRLCDRIRELAWARKQATGNALVPLKDALIKQAMADKGLETEKSRLGYRDIDPKWFRMGQAAGDRVGLNPGINGGRGDFEALPD